MHGQRFTFPIDFVIANNVDTEIFCLALLNKGIIQI